MLGNNKTNIITKVKNNRTPNFLWYSTSENGLKAFTPKGVKESNIIWLLNPKKIENTSNVKLIFKLGIKPKLMEIIIDAIATKNIGDNFLLRNKSAKKIIKINKTIKFIESLEIKLYWNNPMPKNKNRDNEIVIMITPKIEWVNPLWLESKNMHPNKLISKPK